MLGQSLRRWPNINPTLAEKHCIPSFYNKLLESECVSHNIRHLGSYEARDIIIVPQISEQYNAKMQQMLVLHANSYRVLARHGIIVHTIYHVKALHFLTVTPGHVPTTFPPRPQKSDRTQ